MQIYSTAFDGLFEIQPTIFHDERGYFFESFHSKVFQSNGLPFEFVQDNQSFSKKGVVRGLHLQKGKHAQGKLVKVMTGSVLDVVLDIRPESKTFGKHAKFILSSEKNNMLWVPPGFAHGFAALEDSIFYYKCTAPYNKDAESGIVWNDPEIAIDWEVDQPMVSNKDQQLPDFKAFIALEYEH